MSAAPVERKLAAIFAADIAGYSRLMARDEIGTLTRLKASRAIIDGLITSHRGRVFNTAGDSVVADFASAVDAVQCAVAIQMALAEEAAEQSADERLAFRIGVHVGDVIVDGTNLLGGGVNIAARLEALAEPGGVCISAPAREHVGNKLPVAFDDLGQQHVKNIPEPIHVYRVRTETSVAPSAATPVPVKPSIAVLPFQNMSGDLEQEYFADGMVEDIITALSRFKSLLVIARNTSFTYKGKAVDIKQVGQELGVRYVLEGSVRKGGGRIRITGQLIDAETGSHLWADKFDGTLEDVFDLQDRVASSVVGAIGPAVEFAESARTKRKPPASLDSYDLFLRGSSAVWEGRLRQAISYFKQAIEKDPECAGAYGLCAGAYVVLQAYSGEPISREEQAEAVRFANMAATLGIDDALTLIRAAQALVKFDNQYDRALAMSDRAVALNPNSASVWLIHGWVNNISSRHQESINSFSKVLQYSELDPARIGACCGISYGCFHLGRYDEGCEWAEKALQKYENTLYLIPLIANASAGGREVAARSAVARLLRIAPGFGMSRFRKLFNSRDGDEALARALRDAGLPE